jgi:hypothetical protein
MKVCMSRWFSACLCLLGSFSTVSAQAVTFDFSGIVTDSDLTEFAALDTVAGQFTFDSSNADTDPAPNSGLYAPGVTAYSISFSGGYTGSLDAGGTLTSIQVVDDDPIDIFSVLANISGNSVDGFVPEISTVNVLRETDSGTLITSPGLPSTPPNLGLADITEGVLRFADDNNVRYNILTLTLSTGGGNTDYDDDAIWGLGDLNLVLFNWNEDGANLPPAWLNGRPEAGTLVGLPELNQVLFNWGQPGSLAVAVPEPAALVMGWLGLVALLGLARKS